MSSDNRYLDLQFVYNRERADLKLFQDASGITSGASNPVAVATVLAQMGVYLSRNGVSPQTHPAFRTVLDQLNCIVFGGSLAAGADYLAVLDAVNDNDSLTVTL